MYFGATDAPSADVLARSLPAKEFYTGDAVAATSPRKRARGMLRHMRESSRGLLDLGDAADEAARLEARADAVDGDGVTEAPSSPSVAGSPRHRGGGGGGGELTADSAPWVLAADAGVQDMIEDVWVLMRDPMASSKAHTAYFWVNADTGACVWRCWCAWSATLAMTRAHL